MELGGHTHTHTHSLPPPPARPCVCFRCRPLRLQLTAVVGVERRGAADKLQSKKTKDTKCPPCRFHGDAAGSPSRLAETPKTLLLRWKLSSPPAVTKTELLFFILGFKSVKCKNRTLLILVFIVSVVVYIYIVFLFLKLFYFLRNMNKTEKLFSDILKHRTFELLCFYELKVKLLLQRNTTHPKLE